MSFKGHRTFIFTFEIDFCSRGNAVHNEIRLTKGNKYYFEVFFMDVTNDDFLLMWMHTPSGDNRLVTFNDLEPYYYNYY